MMQTSYSIITELPGTKVSREQLSRAYLRYKFAQGFCRDKDVLELAGGGGQGLGILAEVAHSVIGSDIDEANLSIMKSTYAAWKNIRIEKIDAQKITLQDRSVDVIVFFEAIYYLSDVQAFLRECKRILRKPGKIIICSANKEWRDFNPSVFSVRYFSAREMAELLESQSFAVSMFYADKVLYIGYKAKLVSMLKRTAVRMNLIPRSMRFKKHLKRLFMGSLVPMPPVLDDSMGKYNHPDLLSIDRYDPDFKIMFAVAELNV
jgi:ubiquinone/menaquinone biosynthesis C-methylase UbiE